MTSSNFELVRIVETNNNKPVKQGVSKITKDENGLIAIQQLKLDNNQQMIESIRLTASSFHRALVENIASSYIAEIDTILQAVISNAQQQAEVNASQHLTNRLGEINNLVADFKQRSLERQKQYLNVEKVEKPSIWATPIDFYNIGEVQESSLGGEDSSTVETEVIEMTDEEQLNF